MDFAVVGHVEWVEFVRVDRLPAGGQIAHGSDGFEEPAGGGAVAAAQLAGLAGSAELFTALGADDHGEASRRRLTELGVGVHVAQRDQPTRRAITMIDPAGERTITTVGERLAPHGRDPLPWERLDGADGVYFTAGDADALRAARGAKTLAVTPRAGTVLSEAGVEIDVLVYSDRDAGESETVASLGLEPRLEVATRGRDGGVYKAADGSSGEWEAVDPPGEIADDYGCGDSFAAALCWALASGKATAEALVLAARAGASCVTGRGPYVGQLSAEDL
jgi:ribokinase